MSEHPDELIQKYVEAMDQEPGWRVSDSCSWSDSRESKRTAP